MKAFDCLGIGLCPLDRLMLLQRYPGVNEKHVAIDSRTCGGGPVANAVFTLAKLGDKTAFCGKIGFDPDGGLAREELESAGVNTNAMIISPDERTASAHIWVDARTGERTVVLDETNLSQMTPDEIPIQLLENCRFLLLDGRNPETSMEAASIARKAGAKVLFDLGSMRNNLPGILSSADYVIASEDFARAYNPESSNIMETARKLVNEGPKTVVITLGQRGWVWKDSSGEGEDNAFKVKVVDTTGAGDVFHGAFIHGLIKRWETPKAARFAGAAAALACTILGGRGGVKSEKQVLKFMGESIY